MSRDRSIDTADERTALLSEHSRSNSCSCSEHGFDEEDGHGHDHGHGYESFPERQNLLTSKVDSHLKGQWKKNLVLLVGNFLSRDGLCLAHPASRRRFPCQLGQLHSSRPVPPDSVRL